MKKKIKNKIKKKLNFSLKKNIFALEIFLKSVKSKQSMKKFLCAFFIHSFFFFQAQKGENVYNFLNTPFSTKQASMGGETFSTRDDDAVISLINPSAMNPKMGGNIHLNYANFLADSNIGTLAYVKNLENGHFLGLGAKYMNFGSIPRTDEAGFVQGNFNAADIALGVNYAYQFEPQWSIGTGINLISSKIDTFSSMALSAQLGVSYHSEDNTESVSLVARNFGYQFKTYNGIRENLPFRVDLSYSKKLENFPALISITAHNLQKFNLSEAQETSQKKIGTFRKILDHFAFGAELFPDKSFNIRLGYHIKRGNELAVLEQRNFTGLSVGFGIKVSHFKLDYAHSRYHNASNMNMIGISLNIPNLSKKSSEI